jgi:hypothetical protein
MPSFSRPRLTGRKDAFSPVFGLELKCDNMFTSTSSTIV